MMLLDNLNAQSLYYWLSQFVVQILRNNGNPYLPTSILNILAGLYQYCKALVPDCPNFMDTRNQHFMGALQVRYHELHKEGVRMVVKHAPIVTEEEEEDTLWRNIMVEHSPLPLQRAMFFLCW